MTGTKNHAIILLPRGACNHLGSSPPASYVPYILQVSTRSKENVMAFIRLPLGIRVAVEYEVFGKIVVNVYHVTTTDPIVTLKLFDIAEIFEAWWLTDMSPGFSNEIALTTVTALNLNEANGEKITLVVAPPIPGGAVELAVSNNVAIVASFATPKTGRSFRGRAYQAGLPRDAITENKITTVKAAAIVTDYLALQALLAFANTDFVVASFQSGGVPRSEGIATEIESISVNTRVDTQRRRLPAS